MKKLYHRPEHAALESFAPVIEQSGVWPAEEDFQGLSACVSGFCNAGTLYDSVASESYTLVDAKNRGLYNAYARLLAEKLGVSMPELKQVSVHALESGHGVTVNSEIALEGWIGNLWEKIKGFFGKMYEGIKAFFAKHFTRLGKAKKALENLQVVLDKTDKSLVQPNLDNYTGSLLKRYAGYGDVNASSVKQSLTNVGHINASLNTVNKRAEGFANKHMVDKEFFTKLKSLKDLAAASDGAKQDIDDNTPGQIKSLVDRDARAERKSKTAESKTLSEVSQHAKSDASSMDGEVTTLSSGEAGAVEENAAAAKKDMEAFMEEVKKALGTSINAKLISGKVIKDITINDTLDLTVDMDDTAVDATGVTLAGKTDLLFAVKTALTMLAAAERDMTQYGKINDVIMKNLSTVDSLIKDIDKIDPEQYGKYKKLLNEQVRERLQMLRKFFSAYNKVGKNILDMGIDCCEGVVDYGVLSLKHYGDAA